MEKIYNMKREEHGSKSLINIVLSWSIKNVLKKDLYKHQVKKIPETFFSTEQYLRAPKDLLYVIVVKGATDAENNDVGKYEPEAGDIIAFTDVRPKWIDDLSRPGRSFHIAYVHGARDESTENITILSSKYLETKEEMSKRQKQVLAVYLMNMTTNVRIWKALNSEMEGRNLTIIEKILMDCSPLFNARNIICTADLNESQEKAVLSCVSMRECRHGDTFKLIWGPPGTGKTKTVAVLLFSLLKLKGRTLTCVPTNTTVMEVAARLLRIVKESLEFGMYGLGDIVLFGNSA
ncbi:p-loop nucleoside triphosphate hydrolase superfamily protein [Quillaja saponaria]|uniref:P-loop nucleoside triphosphate hydrolase superfamily protein n=1 Tax=Quillaja saponaria TaxID=32244 RepID=A0AAD7LL75_QUISA|nr:p-loop nucleoside triphosphate hydrolase superfamily protein [Quillaja saponaria]